MLNLLIYVTEFLLSFFGSWSTQVFLAFFVMCVFVCQVNEVQELQGRPQENSCGYRFSGQGHWYWAGQHCYKLWHARLSRYIFAQGNFRFIYICAGSLVSFADDGLKYPFQVGRAGRFGTKGLAITFVSSASDSDVLNQVCLSALSLVAVHVAGFGLTMVSHVWKVQERFEVDIKELPEQIDTSTYSKWCQFDLVWDTNSLLLTL